jgi:hypothetical protein
LYLAAVVEAVQMWEVFFAFHICIAYFSSESMKIASRGQHIARLHLVYPNFSSQEFDHFPQADLSLPMLQPFQHRRALRLSFGWAVPG